MFRISTWNQKQQDASVEAFQKMLAKESKDASREHAEQAGYDFGEALVNRDLRVGQLTANQLESWRKRYAVAPEFLDIFKQKARATRREHLRWNEETAVYA